MDSTYAALLKLAKSNDFMAVPPPFHYYHREEIRHKKSEEKQIIQLVWVYMYLFKNLRKLLNKVQLN